MTSIGLALPSGEHSATDLIEYTRRAEEAGFDFSPGSDRYHP